MPLFRLWFGVWFSNFGLVQGVEIVKLSLGQARDFACSVWGNEGFPLTSLGEGVKFSQFLVLLE